MINLKNLFALLIFFLLLCNCSFDSKSGIWGDNQKEKKRISDLEKRQKGIIVIDKIYSSEKIFTKEIAIRKKITLTKSYKNSTWQMSGSNYQNNLGHFFLSNTDEKLIKKKIGKNKNPIPKKNTTLLSYKGNLIFSDDRGIIYNVTKNVKQNWKINIYKKTYKNIYKNLTLSIYEDNLYVADNMGFIYSISLVTKKLLWIKNHGVPFKSNIKVFDNKIYVMDQDNRILCFDTIKGLKIWDLLTISSFIKSQNLFSLALTNSADLLVLNSSADLFKINGKDGSVIYTTNTSGSTLLDASDFFVSSDLVLTKKEIIFSASDTIYSYDINNPIINWETQVSSVSSPIINNGNIFIVTRNGYFVILDQISGEIISSNNILKVLKKKHQETKIVSFIMASGKIYSLTKNGFIIVSSPFSGKVESFKKTGEILNNDPIIYDGNLFIITANAKIIRYN